MRMQTNTTFDSPPPGRRPQAALGIGERLAEHRTRRGLRVSALAAAVGVSASLISQIERGHSRPSVSTLFALAEALGVPVDDFFRGEDADGYERSPAVTAASAPFAGDDRPAQSTRDPREGRYVVRRADRAAIDIEGGVRWERLTPGPLVDLEFMSLSYAPGAESNPTPYRHPGNEMVLVLSGRLEISIGFETHDLGPGDSICFPSTAPHRYVNPTEQATQAVTVILPDGIASGPSTNRRT
jgi:transcriptional regulator with XRE-family HTH domain